MQTAARSIPETWQAGVFNSGQRLLCDFQYILMMETDLASETSIYKELTRLRSREIMLMLVTVKASEHFNTELKTNPLFSSATRVTVAGI
jgi:hypothetical protein